jgi:tetratricopeptide (TPR) repeat protein
MSRWLDYLIGISGLLVAGALVGWGGWRMLKQSYDPVKLLLKLAFTLPFVFFAIKFAHFLGPVGPFVIVAMAVVLSIMWTPNIAEWISGPITGLFDGGTEEPDKKPFYSIANAKRKRGHYDEAIAEIRKQLAKFPNDFEGHMLLASIQSENQRDLAAAENTLNKFCALKDAPDKQVAAAWTTLADWHLKIGVDVDAAATCLSGDGTRVARGAAARASRGRGENVAGRSRPEKNRREGRDKKSRLAR